MGNKKKNQKKPAKQKAVEMGCIQKPEAGPSQIPRKLCAVEKHRPTRNKASMKMFEQDSSSGTTTPDPYADDNDGEYGCDGNYNPEYDDELDSSSSANEHENLRKNRQTKKKCTVSQYEPSSERDKGSSPESDADAEGSDEDTECSESDDSEYDTDSVSVASSNESIFDTKKRTHPSTSKKSSPLEPKCKKPKIASADESTDNMSLESEVLLRNVSNLNFESSSVLPDPTELENMSIYTHIERTHTPSTVRLRDRVAAEDSSALTTSLLLNLEASEENREPTSLPSPNLETAEGNHALISSPALHPDAAEDNHALASSPAPDLEAAEENHTSINHLAPDPEAAEENHAFASSPALDPEVAEGNHALASSPALDPEADRAPTNSPTPDPELVEGNHALVISPAPVPEATEENHTTASSTVPHPGATRSNMSTSPSVLNPEVAEGNPVPARPAALDLDAAERNRALTNTPLPNYDWEHTTADIPVFEFDESSAGVQFNADPNTTVMEIFEKIFPPNIIDYIVTCTNEYGRALCEKRRPTTRNSRSYNFRDTNREEILKFFGLCLLMGQVKIPKKRKNFTYSEPLYYHPVFHYVMSARRFEQILRCIYVSELNSKGKDKIEKFIDAITKNFRECYKPFRHLSLDESLLLFRGRLAFRQYMKGKKARYGIKFFELTTSDGYVLNIMMYLGKDTSVPLQTGKKTEKIVLRLMRPYLLKGHHLYMDNYYNSVTLSQKLVDLKTHTTGTLRANRKDNPKDITKKKLKKNQHVWVRKNKVYVSKWVDKRPVLMVTTSTHPNLIEVRNRFQQRKIKPAEVAEYNQYMSGIDRADQMIAYYSSPRKSLRWYKKVLFHILDVAVWNSFYIFKKYCQNRCDFLLYREELIRKLMDLPSDLKTDQLTLARSKYDNRRGANVLAPLRINDDIGSSMVHGHWPEKIPVREGSNKTSKYLKCKMCTKNKIRKETCLRCKGCPEKPALCALCFEEWHNQV